MSYRIDHIQITVTDLNEAEFFYDKMFEYLGYDISKKYKGYLEHANMEVIEYLSDGFDFGICSPRSEFKDEAVNSRKPGNVQHIAFFAESRGKVDEFYHKIKELDVKILHDKPMEYKERIAPNYYALFFESPDGIRFEVFHYPK
ncbi:VOC family protein [Breznakia pachnodae]|uniref:Catechol 2,3-dioxygenase-like lactoylglutathione lyase family enzyme n=1 Tax=Breznakia pachnodae TaxID=265178 RepID=A0ABU0E5Y4_9FIRM|nr:VOC family protein [Breznakia pachnodae]MDQ0362136.1 catechol 2,3-dioxygenase-like lactoylglutathione lyase family enzyme [Breznakia pachnodae]